MEMVEETEEKRRWCLFTSTSNDRFHSPLAERRHRAALGSRRRLLWRQ